MKKCSVVGCGKTTHAKGFCQGHYVQFKKHGAIIKEKLKVLSPKRRNLPTEATCRGCGKVFKIKQGKFDAKFCSQECNYLNRPRKNSPTMCASCGVEFYSSRKTVKYCSNKCRYVGNKKQITVYCSVCGKEINRAASAIKWHKIRNGKNQYCSTKCLSLGVAVKFKGEKSPLWKGGASRAYKNGYHNTEYCAWRKRVFERDRYTCQYCGKVGGKLEAHHIFRFSYFPDLRNVDQNGITLCHGCHQTTKKYDKSIQFQKLEAA